MPTENNNRKEKIHKKSSDIIRTNRRGLYTTNEDFFNQKYIREKIKELSSSSISKAISKNKSEVDNNNS